MTPLPAEADVVIVGAGFSGLGMAIRLREAGMEDFLVLERGADVGGTWWWNDYPGCGCDVPSNLYSYSFAPNPDWTDTFSKQGEIEAYLRRCADTFGVRPRIRLDCSLTDARWDDATARWTVATSDGTLTARVLVSAAGHLFAPRVPDLPGLDGFGGRVFHSARWEHDFDPRGKRVAVVGTGASAIQFVPEIAPQAAHVTVFQRTAPWVMPHPGRPTTRFERVVYRRFPLVQKVVRGLTYGQREALVLGLVKQPRIMRIAERIARGHQRAQLSDPALRAKVQPDYALGCKRILPSNRWYPALERPDVDLVTSGIREVRPGAVVTTDGREVPADAIVFGTGFMVTDMPIAHHLHGRDGTLAERWSATVRAHRGCTVPGFPNLFLLLGPNTGLGHGSMVYMIESQVAYVMEALKTLRARGSAVAEVTEAAFLASNAELDRRLARTVWSTGCSSWYADRTGRISALWPDWTFVFRRRLARFDADGYDLRPAAAA